MERIKTDAERRTSLPVLPRERLRPGRRVIAGHLTGSTPVLVCLGCGRNLAVALHLPGCPDSDAGWAVVA